MQERRRYPRHLPSRELTGKVKSAMDFRVVDISEGGVLVETRLGLPPSTICELKVSSCDGDCVFKAEVRRCRVQMTKTEAGCKVAYRSGLEFVEVDDDGMSGIRQLISSFCAGAEAQNRPMSPTEEPTVLGSLHVV